MNLRTIVLTLAAAGVLAATGAAAEPAHTWTADPVHSSAQFTATHFGISHVTGIIPITVATITGVQPQLPTSISATLAATGVDTRNDDRNSDLKSDHFFDVAKYPTLTFASTSIVPIDAKTFNVVGNLTLHGVTKPITLKTTYLGQVVDRRGRQHVGYEATTSIKRSDFGMTYGPVIVGDDIEITIDVEALGPAAATTP
jgi:polyisoprenoid-binding protein YceI